jgi:hypothetical protein
VFESRDKGTGELGVVLADGELKRGHGLGEALGTAGCVRSRGIRVHRTLKTGLKVGGLLEILYELHIKLAPRLGIGERLAIPSFQNDLVQVSTSPTSQKPAAAAAPTPKFPARHLSGWSIRSRSKI